MSMQTSGRVVWMWINVCSSLLFQTNKNEVFFDKDTIIHIEQKNAKFCCHVYKLFTTKT